MARRLERGEIRLYRFASPNKQRPVLVLTRGSAIRYLSRVTVAPITSTVRGVPSEIVLDLDDGMKHPCAVNLHNIATISQESLGRRLTQLSSQRMREVGLAIAFALGCEG
ncbi:type II toxin-antitoxin system PemK/MazF family toxin [Acidobacteria bacterium AH-259-L09]|nr:type II toxin-antitoxin system PemK/MazF family toxin [Acidobacteria bacterium AH-259-L09]